MDRDKTIYTLGLLLAFLLLLAGRDLGPLTLPVTAPADNVTVAESQPLIALTFDDGPFAPTTEPLLEELERRGVHATFFLIGEQIEGNEELIRRMGAEGHQIGIHTWSHVGLSGLNDRDFYSQVGRTANALRGVIGGESFAIRPPYGYVDNRVEARAGAPIVLWSVDPEDWKYRDADRVARHILENAKDGDIVLLHDIYPTSVQAALAVMDALQDKGFRFVTVDEMAALRGVELQPGQVYRNFYPPAPSESEKTKS